MHTMVTAHTAAPAIARGSQQTRPAADVAAWTAGSVRTCSKDDEIFSEGDRAAYVYKVVSGVVRTSKLLSDGRRQIDAFHLAGDIFGIETGNEHRSGAEAVGDTVVIAYRRCGLESLATTDSQFAQQLIWAMMRSLERAQVHILLLGRKTALEKIAGFLLDLAERASGGDGIVDLPMSRADIADHLGLTIETVSRCLMQLEKDAVIRLPARRRIVLSDKAALCRLNS
jgi:CRP/FNR family nitrogen fixation transcriptional regulator